MANRTIVTIKRYTSGPTRERLNINSIIIDLVLHMKDINIEPVYLIMCWRLKIGKALISY